MGCILNEYLYYFITEKKQFNIFWMRVSPEEK